MKGITRKTLYPHLLEKQFNILEYTTIDALLSKGGWQEWVISPIQAERYKKYAIKLIQGVLKCSKKKAEKAFEEFIQLHGLKVK